MAESIVSSLLSTLGGLPIQEAKFLWGVEDKVKRLEKELMSMQCFLKDADSKQNENELVRNWVAEIRDAAYDAEDIIETFALKIESQRRGGRTIMNILKRSTCIINEVRTLREIGLKIEAITTNISDSTRRLKDYGIKELGPAEGSSSSHERKREQRRSYPHIVERNIVGFAENIKELVSNLVAEGKHFRVISICGMGGLGKTTLAKQVFHHSQVRGHFDLFAWAYVSQQCQRRDVWEGILISLSSKEQREEIQKMREEELAPSIHQLLKEKKCLVVLDDIWSIQAWNSLRAAFPDEEMGSKILLTSHNKDVALHADRRGMIHEPKCLDDEVSWELLQNIVIPERDNTDFKIDTRMEELGRKMVKHCRGLPLAITMVGGILATKNSFDEWCMVEENITSYLRRGKGLGQEEITVKDVLDLSYNDLPTELKPCFLYLSQFPEDYEINVGQLIRMWVAEGFVISAQHYGEEEEVLEDMAQHYLEELIERCMVLVGETDARLGLQTKFWTCRLHDLVRDMCVLKAKEENFLHIKSWHGDNDVAIFSSMLTDKVRRLAVHLFGNEFPLKRIKDPHLRSLFMYTYTEWRLRQPVFGYLKLLRVLKLEYANIGNDKLSKDIGKLIHLRFLSLRGCKVSKLPSSLGNLRCLQTLNLNIKSIVHVPNVIWKMEGLRHLYLPRRCDDKTKLRLGNLRSLQTLMYFSFRNFDTSELLNNMTNLRELYIDLDLIKEDFGESFKSRDITLTHLWHLSIRRGREKTQKRAKIDVGPLLSSCIKLDNFFLVGPTEKLPDPHQLPASITYIRLFDTQLEEDPMTTLEKLPNLRNLILDAETFIGKQMVCSGEGFPRLHYLRLFDINLEEWRVDEGAMPNLCRLEIKGCRELKKLPDGLRFVKSLKELEIIRMPMEFQNKLVEGGEDFYKVQHVPSVKFLYIKE